MSPTLVSQFNRQTDNVQPLSELKKHGRLEIDQAKYVQLQDRLERRSMTDGTVGYGLRPFVEAAERWRAYGPAESARGPSLAEVKSSARLTAQEVMQRYQMDARQFDGFVERHGLRELLPHAKDSPTSKYVDYNKTVVDTAMRLERQRGVTDNQRQGGLSTGKDLDPTHYTLRAKDSRVFNRLEDKSLTSKPVVVGYGQGKDRIYVAEITLSGMKSSASLLVRSVADAQRLAGAQKGDRLSGDVFVVRGEHKQEPENHKTFYVGQELQITREKDIAQVKEHFKQVQEAQGRFVHEYRGRLVQPVSMENGLADVRLKVETRSGTYEESLKNLKVTGAQAQQLQGLSVGQEVVLRSVHTQPQAELSVDGPPSGQELAQVQQVKEQVKDRSAQLGRGAGPEASR